MTRVNDSTLVFFDASCLIFVASSPTGGSGWIWLLCERWELRAAISAGVLEEAERNLARKFPEAVRQSFRTRLENVGPQQLITIGDGAVEAIRNVPTGVNEKDRHVVSSALTLGADYLHSLDQRLILEIRETGLEITAVTPREFIKIHLPTHPGYRKFPDLS